MHEREMRPAIDAWLTARQCVVFYEAAMLGNCDVVGVQFAKRTSRRIPKLLLAVAVELKLRDIAGVILQARGHLECVHKSYAAMPRDFCQRMRPDSFEKFRKTGVGLLSVAGDEVTLVIESSHGTVSDYFRKRLWRRTRAVIKAAATQKENDPCEA